jgi:hypothetical protein
VIRYLIITKDDADKIAEALARSDQLPAIAQRLQDDGAGRRFAQPPVQLGES